MKKNHVLITLLLGCLVMLTTASRCNSEESTLTSSGNVENPSTGSEDKATPTPAPSKSKESDLLLAMPGSRTDIPEQILQRKAYVASFNNKTLQPNWVAWYITAKTANGNVKRSGIKFHEDMDVPAAYRVTTNDYVRSGYDRGHMCPAGDNRWDMTAMTESFLMTNICPQLHNLNAGDWNEIEGKCRKWAEQYGKVYVVSGPIFYKNNRKKIGKVRKIAVPDAFFKVVLCMEGKPKAIGFIYKNQEGNRPMGDYVNSVDEVERITGYDFFPTLEDDVENRVEASANLDEWNN